MQTTNEEKITNLLERIADALERIAESLAGRDGAARDE